MADARRRTLATSGSHAPIVPSSIPRPTTSLRQSMAASTTAGANRLSLAPSAMGRSGRASIAPSGMGMDGGSQESQMFSQGHGGPREVPSTVGRQGAYMSQGAMSMSVGRSGTLRTNDHVPLSERRSTNFRRSTVGSVSNTPSGNRRLEKPNRDPRADKEWKAANPGYKTRWANDILTFLNARSYPLPIELKHLTQNPTGNMFQAVFKFLISQFDENYLWSGTNKTFEMEVPLALKSVGYPFVESITKSHLQAVGSMTTWPNMLAMLHWLVATMENRQAAFDNCVGIHMPQPSSETEDAPFDIVIGHAWLEFVGDTYPKFLASDDFDNTPELEEFNARLEAGREVRRAKVDDLEEEQAALTKELAELESTPDPLYALQDKKLACDRDQAKFDAYLESSRRKLEMQKEIYKNARLRREELHKDHRSGAEQVHQLTKLVEAQGMTPVEISTMNNEKSNLQKANEALNRRTATVLDKTLSLEIEVANALTRSEGLINDYTAKAEHLNILPTPPDGYEHVDFHQEISGAVAPNIESLVILKPTLVELRSKAKEECEKLNLEDVVLEEKITRTKEAIMERKETVETDETELEELKREDSVAREADKVEDTREKAENARLQSAVDQLKMTMTVPLQTAQWRFDQRVQERSKMIQDSDELRRLNRSELESTIEAVMVYKEEMINNTNKLVALSRGQVP